MSNGAHPVPREGAPPSDPADSHISGIVHKDGYDADPRETPPWEVVHAYLARGEHRAWVEGHAALSRAFADVLAALQNDQEERAQMHGPPPSGP